MKNVLIICTSPRKGGNSDTLAAEFARGAKEAGNEVEIISLAGKHIEFCLGCLSCVKTQKCVIDDDATEIRGMMLNADVIVWATPVYYYCISGQMKTMIDRGNPLYRSDYKFRDVYLLAAAAADEDYTMEGAVKATQGWIDCFEKASLKGVVFAGGVDKKGEIAGHKALADAHEMGSKV